MRVCTLIIALLAVVPPVAHCQSEPATPSISQTLQYIQDRSSARITLSGSILTMVGGYTYEINLLNVHAEFHPRWDVQSQVGLYCNNKDEKCILYSNSYRGVVHYFRSTEEEVYTRDASVDE